MKKFNLSLNKMLISLFLIILVNFSFSFKSKKGKTYTLKQEKNEIFNIENKSFADFFKEKCYSLKGKYSLLKEVSDADMTIKAEPVILIYTKQIFELSLIHNDESFKLFSQGSENLKKIEEMPNTPCLNLTFEEETKSKLIKIHKITICGDTKKKTTELKTTWEEFENTCVNKDPLLVEDFSYLNKLVAANSGYKEEKKGIYDDVAYINPAKPKSKKEIEKELLKGKVASIKNKLLEKKSSESELCRKKKLIELDEKIEKKEEEFLKSQREKKYAKEEAPELNSENDKALKTLNKIEGKLNIQIEDVKKKSEKLDY